MQPEVLQDSNQTYNSHYICSDVGIWKLKVRGEIGFVELLTYMLHTLHHAN